MFKIILNYIKKSKRFITKTYGYSQCIFCGGGCCSYCGRCVEAKANEYQQPLLCSECLRGDD